jgi:hypothetical protein
MAKTDYQKLQARAKKLDIPANQSADALTAAIEAEEKKRDSAKAREKQKANAAAEAKGSTDESRKATSEETPPTVEGGVPPEWHNDPERLLSKRELEAREDVGKGKIEVQTFTPQTHHELTIDFTELMPNTDFEVRISGPTAQPYWVTLKSDGWGQAQLIWRTTAGGDYQISAKGPGIDAKGEFSVTSYDADADYRAAKRARRASAGKRGSSKARKSEEQPASTGSVATVEDPAAMGEDTAETGKNQPTEEELANPEQYEPQFQPAVHDPDDQGDPTINKTPHPEGSAAFNYREPGEPDMDATEESKESPEGTTEAEAEAAAADETAKVEAEGDRAVDEETGVSEHAGMSPPMSQEQVDRENAPTGAEEAGKDEG